jgi:hypothetical protein
LKASGLLKEFPQLHRAAARRVPQDEFMQDENFELEVLRMNFK